MINVPGQVDGMPPGIFRRDSTGVAWLPSGAEAAGRRVDFSEEFA